MKIHQSIPDALAAAFSRFAANAAVADGEETISYAELDRRTDLVAHMIRDRLPSGSATVGMLLDQGRTFPLAFLAAMKAGVKKGSEEADLIIRGRRKARAGSKLRPA